ncbi:MAG TPA: hypothetical protein VE082_07810, partial [Desulfobaccales bacterium]|nr:hypothetical protein [Desulfobaccales bacterium]
DTPIWPTAGLIEQKPEKKDAAHFSPAFMCLEGIGLAEIFGLGRCAAAVFTDEFRVPHILLVLVKVAFNIADGAGHAQMGLMPVVVI